MLNAMTHTQVWVLDQDEALEFYVGRLGLQVRSDAAIRITQPAPEPIVPPSEAASA
jgi:catechol 2,3-dioxygenase-like lactoylglutathione lyase family enzyme